MSYLKAYAHENVKKPGIFLNTKDKNNLNNKEIINKNDLVKKNIAIVYKKEKINYEYIILYFFCKCLTN